MRLSFRQAKQRIRQDRSSLEVIAINGCCYGRDRRPDKGEYYKICGQDFWRLLSGDDTFFTRIIEPLGHKAREHNEQFTAQYGDLKKRMASVFEREFCQAGGAIAWPRLVEFSSAKEPYV